MTRFVFLLGLILAGCGEGGYTETTTPAAAAQTLAFCDYAVDGDTISVQLPTGPERVRLIGVDAPELAAGECYSREANQYATDRLAGTVVVLEAEGASLGRDEYGRLLGYVYASDGRMFNLELIEMGMAVANTHFPFRHAPEFLAAEATAEAARTGLWGSCRQSQGVNP